jgi:Flp pilus assembly protein CpaB
MNEFVGAVARTRVAAGEPITDTRLVRPGERGFLAVVLTPGMRAISVAVNETSGIAGLIFPGDRVDVVLTHSMQDDTGGTPITRRASETVIRDVRVLAIDQNVDSQNVDPKVGRTATLEVTPRQVEMINVMLELGSISLSLRSLGNPEDEAAGADAPVVASGKGAPAAMAGAKPGEAAGLAVAGGDLYHTYTLDTDVSVLLRAPEPAAVAELKGEEPEQAVIVFRGGTGRSESEPAAQ